jgi:serine/threonine protein kinase
MDTEDVQYMLHMPDIISILDIDGSIFKIGSVINVSGNLYTIVKHLEKNAVICKDIRNNPYIIKADSVNSIIFNKEIRISQLLSNGSIHKDFTLESLASAIKYNSASDIIHGDNWKLTRYFCCIGSESESESDAAIPIISDRKKVKYSALLSSDIESDQYVIILPEQFKSSNIPKVIDTFIIADTLYQINSFCGIDMITYINKLLDSKRHLDEKIAKHIFSKLVMIVYQLHKLGIAHGDLSLENICIETNESDITALPIIRLIDFGFAAIHPLSPIYQILGTSKQSNLFDLEDSLNINIDTMICSLKPLNMTYRKQGYGKPTYVSYERYLANFSPKYKYCMYKDDIFALGIIMYILLTGSPPYPQIYNIETLKVAITRGLWRHKSVSKLSDTAYDLLYKMIALESDRISIDEVVTHLWFGT